MAKRKRRATYNLHMTVKMPGEPGTDGTDITMSGPIGPELGRTLWLLTAAMGGLIPANCEREIRALRLALERGIPMGDRAELGRLPEDATALADATTVDALYDRPQLPIREPDEPMDEYRHRLRAHIERLPEDVKVRR